MKACGVICLVLVGCVAVILAVPFVWFFGQNSKEQPTASQHQTASPHSNVPRRSPIRAEPIEITTAANVDERLFLLRLLNEANSAWPDESLPPERLQQELDGLRQQVTRLHGHIHENALDEQLAEVYAKLLLTISAYTAYLEDIGRINQQAASGAGNDPTRSVGSALQNGAGLGSVVSDLGATTKQSIATAGAVALSSYLWEKHQENKARDAARGQAINLAQSRMRTAVGEYLTACRQVATDLTRKYKWKPGEAGFDDSADYDATWAKLVEANNVEGLIQLQQTVQTVRPRDPFVVRDKAFLTGMSRDGSGAAQATTARECIAAASLIPEGAIFDDYRAAMLGNAARLLNIVSNREATGKGWGMVFSDNAALAVQALNGMLRYQQDFNGEIRECKAWNLFKSGDLAGALHEVEAVINLRRNDPQFAYNLACLYSDCGNADDSLTWLREAVAKNGYNDIANLKKDPDLATVRAKKPAEIANLVALRCGWKIEYGNFNDDLIVTNNSPFTLTHVTIVGAVFPSKKEMRKLTVDAIPAGRSYKWENAVSVPGSKVNVDDTSLNLRCDQGECKLMPKF